VTGESLHISDASSILRQTKQYLRQQEGLYGSEIYLTNTDLLKKPVKSSKNSLKQLGETLSQCRMCSLFQTRRHVVFGSGPENAALMLIGEAPGEEEDRTGKPFVGKAGQLLDKILEAIDFSRDDVYITNILKCRPPMNRDPKPEEITTCLPFLQNQIALIRPKIILALGRIAAQTLSGSTNPLSRLRGQTHAFDHIPFLATYHPAALLRHAEWKKPTWEDIKNLRRLYDRHVGDKPAWRQ